MRSTGHREYYRACASKPVIRVSPPRTYGLRFAAYDGSLSPPAAVSRLKMGIKEVSEKIWLVTFMNYDLGFFGDGTGRGECADNPFVAKGLPMSPAPCARVVVASFFHRRPLGRLAFGGQHDQPFLHCAQAEDGRSP